MAMRSDSGWRARLVESYADLFHPKGEPPYAAGWPNVGDGWEDLLQRACRRIRDAVRADGGTFEFSQVKEKFGSLRIYWRGGLSRTAAARVEEAIDLAEARSGTTCEVCGERGVLRAGGWMTTRCDAHAEGRRPIAAQPGDDIHAVQRIVGRKNRVRYRIYDREADAFVEVPPPSQDEER